MGKGKGKFSLTGLMIAVLSLLVVTITVLMGSVLFNQARRSTKEMINDRMLDIANTAADLLDGDAMEGLNKEDVNTPAYQNGLDTLRSFQHNIDLAYIYCILDKGNGEFVFGIDPSDDPGEFGSPVVYTEALDTASRGTPAVDETPYQDHWGTFYSAYSPVRNSRGEIVCMVAVDFRAEWYNRMVGQFLQSILFVGALALVTGIVITMLITTRIRDQLREVNQDVREIAEGVEKLALRYHLPIGTGEDPEVFAQTSEMKAIRQRLRKASAELQEFVRQTQEQAWRDSMTGAGNRSAYLERVEELSRQIEAGKADFAIGIFDINSLKQINDSYGHEYGDQLIIESAKAIADVFGKENIYRIGGDEFIAVIPGGTDATIAGQKQQLEERIQLVNRKLGHREISLTISKGFAVFNPYTERDYRTLFSRADQDMYGNKEAYYRFEEQRRKLRDTTSSASRNRAREQFIIDHLEQAIAEKQIQAYFQPIIRLANEKVSAEEALARWVDPERGTMSPAEFIPVLEDARLVYKLDLYMVDLIMESIRKKKERGIPVIPVSCNLSRTDFSSCDIVEEITKRVDAAGVERELLNIEITESLVGSDFEFMKIQIERLQRLGFHVWMDDFGSGYSSLDVLQNIRFHSIKLDMRFMHQFDGSDRSRIILTELISLAMSLGINTIVEGVERQDQVDFLKDIGCDKIQGYFYSAPISLEEILDRHGRGTIRIGLENPGETDYYNAIGKVNLHDPSLITNVDREQDYSNYFNTLPTAILEISGNEAEILRSNRTYRDFLKRYFGYEYVEGQRNILELGQLEGNDLFRNTLLRFKDRGGWEKMEETLSDGSVVHAFIREVARNPVSGKVALALAVLAIMD